MYKMPLYNAAFSDVQAISDFFSMIHNLSYNATPTLRNFTMWDNCQGTRQRRDDLIDSIAVLRDFLASWRCCLKYHFFNAIYFTNVFSIQKPVILRRTRITAQPILFSDIVKSLCQVSVIGRFIFLNPYFTISNFLIDKLLFHFFPWQSRSMSSAILRKRNLPVQWEIWKDQTTHRSPRRFWKPWERCGSAYPDKFSPYMGSFQINPTVSPGRL